MRIRPAKIASPSLYVSLVVVLFGSLGFGYVIGYSSPALPGLESEKLFEKHQSTWFGSLLLIGALFGSPVGGFLLERHGRKRSTVFASFPLLLGLSIIGISSRVEFLYFGRLLTGFASGIVILAVPVYIAEISPREKRGQFGSSVQLSITIGILLVQVLGISLHWRHLAFAGTIFPLLLILGANFIPETPRWLIMHNRRSEAIRSLQRLRGPGYDAEDECRDIEESLDPNDSALSVWDFQKPELFLPLRVSIGLLVFQQLTGINVIMFYTTSLFIDAGLGDTAPYATVIIGTVQVIFTFVACMYMDRYGRRALSLLGGVGQMLACFSFGCYYHMIKTGASKSGLSISSLTSTTDSVTAATSASLGWLALSSLIAYMIAFSLGWGPVPMLITSEIFPSKARGTAGSIAITVHLCFAFLVTKSFHDVTLLIGRDGVFWLFSAFCGLASLFVYKYVPETKGKTLEDIELYFLGRSLRNV